MMRDSRSASVPVPAIDVAGVSKTHHAAHGDVRALERTSLRIEPGEFVSILGPSGCGKSTLLSLMAGLDAPSEGQILFDGADRDPSDRRVALNFQEPALFPWRTIKGNVTIALEHTGIPKSEISSRAVAALTTVGLEQFTDAYPAHLSGGMKQRAMLARALAVEAPVMLMDEPFGALDAITREAMQELLVSLYAERAMTVVFVTHSIEEALYMSSRVIVMSARPGRVIHEVRLGEPFPRGYEWRLSDEVSELRLKLHNLLKDESATLSQGTRP